MTFEEAVDWFLASSADPEKLSLTVKGLLYTLVPIAITMVRIYGIDNVEQSTITSLIDSFANAFAYVGFAITLGMSFIGAMRRALIGLGKVIS